MLYKSLVTLKADVPLEPPVGLGFEGYNEHVERLDKIKATTTAAEETAGTESSVTAAVFPVLSVDDLSITTTTTSTSALPLTSPSSVSPYLSGLTTRHFRFIGKAYYATLSYSLCAFIITNIHTIYTTLYHTNTYTTGEREPAKATEVALKGISTGLITPLNSLRYSYSRLDRTI